MRRWWEAGGGRREDGRRSSSGTKRRKKKREAEKEKGIGYSLFLSVSSPLVTHPPHTLHTRAHIEKSLHPRQRKGNKRGKKVPLRRPSPTACHPSAVSLPVPPRRRHPTPLQPRLSPRDFRSVTRSRKVSPPRSFPRNYISVRLAAPPVPLSRLEFARSR
jgi:hypothetical protein